MAHRERHRTDRIGWLRAARARRQRRHRLDRQPGRRRSRGRGDARRRDGGRRRRTGGRRAVDGRRGVRLGQLAGRYRAGRHAARTHRAGLGAGGGAERADRDLRRRAASRPNLRAPWQSSSRRRGRSPPTRATSLVSPRSWPPARSRPPSRRPRPSPWARACRSSRRSSRPSRALVLLVGAVSLACLVALGAHCRRPPAAPRRGSAPRVSASGASSRWASPQRSDGSSAPPSESAKASSPRPSSPAPCQYAPPTGQTWRGPGLIARRPVIGQTLGHYRIVREIGASGMGVVYQAEDTTLGRRITLRRFSRRSWPAMANAESPLPKKPGPSPR